MVCLSTLAVRSAQAEPVPGIRRKLSVMASRITNTFRSSRTLGQGAFASSVLRPIAPIGAIGAMIRTLSMVRGCNWGKMLNQLSPSVRGGCPGTAPSQFAWSVSAGWTQRLQQVRPPRSEGVAQSTYPECAYSGLRLPLCLRRLISIGIRWQAAPW